MQQQNITRGVPSRLIADNAPLYQGSTITKYLSNIHISLWQCEAKYQHQNYMGCCWQVVKRYTNYVLDRSGAPATMWLYAMLLVIFCLNNIVDQNLACRTESPIVFSTGNLDDISPMLQSVFGSQFTTYQIQMNVNSQERPMRKEVIMLISRKYRPFNDIHYCHG